MDILVLANQRKYVYFSSVQTQDAVERTCQEQWPTGIDDKSVKGTHAISTIFTELKHMTFHVLLGPEIELITAR